MVGQTEIRRNGKIPTGKAKRAANGSGLGKRADFSKRLIVLAQGDDPPLADQWGQLGKASFHITEFDDRLAHAGKITLPGQFGQPTAQSLVALRRPAFLFVAGTGWAGLGC